MIDTETTYPDGTVLVLVERDYPLDEYPEWEIVLRDDSRAGDAAATGRSWFVDDVEDQEPSTLAEMTTPGQQAGTIEVFELAPADADMDEPEDGTYLAVIRKNVGTGRVWRYVVYRDDDDTPVADMQPGDDDDPAVLGLKRWNLTSCCAEMWGYPYGRLDWAALTGRRHEPGDDVADTTVYRLVAVTPAAAG